MEYSVEIETETKKNGDVEIRVYVGCPNGKTAGAAIRIGARELDAVENKQILIEWSEQRALSRAIVEAHGASRT